MTCSISITDDRNKCILQFVLILDIKSKRELNHFASLVGWLVYIMHSLQQGRSYILSMGLIEPTEIWEE